VKDNNLHNKKLEELSVFFPCYNEDENLPQLLSKANEVIPNLAEIYEIIVINDGSLDNTSKVAHSLASRYKNVKVVDYAKNGGGYGAAIKRGVKESNYKWVFFTDADLQLDLEDLYRFVEVATGDIDLIIGFRANRAEGIARNLIAKLLKIWSKIFFGLPLSIKDIDCAFKLIRKEVFDDIGELKSNGNLISTEILFKAHKKNHKIKQIGVKHYLRASGKSKCSGLRSITKALAETYNLKK
jgi:glycosyltransferase involved in cell wall biosynthesis